MDPVPFRNFLAGNEYSSQADFLGDAANGGAAAEFVKWALALRQDSRSRKGLGDFIQEWGRVNAGFQASRWYSAFAQEVFNLWRIMHLRCVPMTSRPLDNVHGQSRAQRRKMSRTGACKNKEPSVSELSDIIAVKLWARIGRGQWMAWFDNFYRRRFAPSPHNDNLSLNCTAVTLLKLPNALPPFVAFPSLSEMEDSIPRLARDLVASHRQLICAVGDLTSQRIDAKWIRCPLDIKRFGVRSVAWQPFLLSPLETGRQDHLVVLLQLMNQLQSRNNKVWPVLVDEQIHYRILKLMYSVSYSKYRVNTWLTRTPPIYGVWHPYKYALTLCYRSFFPLMVYFANGRLEPGTAVPSFRKIIYMERMFACLLILGHSVKANLAAKLRDCDTHPTSPHIKARIAAIHSLLFEHTPTLFLIGTLVRDCNWGQADSQTALKVLQYSLHVIQHLTLGGENRVEYVRSLSCTLLQWSQWYSSLPGQAHSEEICEALLSRLVQKLHAFPNCTSLDSACELFLLVRPSSTHLKDLTDGKMQADLLPFIRDNMVAVVNAVHRRDVPFVKWSREKQSKVAEVRDPSFAYPAPLSEPISNDHFSDLLRYSLGKVCAPVDVQQKTQDALRAFVPVRTALQEREHASRAGALHKNIPIRYKPRRGVARQDVYFASAMHARAPPAKPKPQPRPQPKHSQHNPPPQPAAAPSLHGANIADASDEDAENFLYEGDSFHSGSEVSVDSKDSSIPVEMLVEDELRPFVE